MTYRNLLAACLVIFILSACSKNEKPVTEVEEVITEEPAKVVEPYVDPGPADEEEQFREDDAEAFSAIIDERKDLKTPESLIRLYYNYPEDEIGESVIMTDSVKLDDGSFEITLIHDRLMDDSMRGIKIVINANMEDGIWTVTEARRNWRCWEGRGHEGWGIGYCQ